MVIDRIVSQIRHRIRAVLGRDTVEQELDEELELHLELEAEKLIRSGLSPDEARRQALIAFGGVERMKEADRDARGMRWLFDSGADLRYAWRGLRRSPGWSAAAIGALALGIGANTAVFSIANWTLLRPVPGVDAPDELVVIEFMDAKGDETGVGHANLLDLEAGSPALTKLEAIASTRVQLAVEGALPAYVDADVVSGDYFDMLGVAPQRGRFFTADERAPTSDARVVVLSDRAWSTLFGRSADVVGRSVEANGTDFLVVGVAEPAFQGSDRVRAVDLWFPTAAYGLLRHWDGGLLERHVGMYQLAIGRLAPGGTPELAQAQLRAAMKRLVDAYPEANEIYDERLPTVFAGIGTERRALESAKERAWLLMGIVAVVLLIACANVANLLLFRSVQRHGEIAVRRALGARWGRVVRQHFVEGLLVSGIGGVLGVLVAIGLVAIFAQVYTRPDLPPISGIAAEPRVLLLTLAIALATGVLFALVPAFYARGVRLLPALSEAGRTRSGRGGYLRGGLTVLQIASSLALVVGALLLIRTLDNLGRIELGFEPEGLTVYSVEPESQGYTPEEIERYRSRVLERVAALPEAEESALASASPFGGIYFGGRLGRDGVDREAMRDVDLFHVTSDYFRTLRLPLIAGRGFLPEESAPVPTAPSDAVILSLSAARLAFGDADPVGRRVSMYGFKGLEARTVVGVAGDIQAKGLRDAEEPIVYLPMSDIPEFQGHAVILVRSGRPRAEVDRAVGEAVANVDPSIPFNQAETLAENLARQSAEERLLATALALFGILSGTLAAIGLYGVLAYSIAQRKHEIGVRMALGGTPAAIVRMVVGEGSTLAAFGGLLGLAAAAALTRLLDAKLFGVSPLDPAVYIAAAALFGVVALLASAAPARAAASVDPVRALRSE